MAGEDAFQNKKSQKYRWIYQHTHFEHGIVYRILNWTQCILAVIIYLRFIIELYNRRFTVHLLIIEELSNPFDCKIKSPD